MIDQRVKVIMQLAKYTYLNIWWPPK